MLINPPQGSIFLFLIVLRGGFKVRFNITHNNRLDYYRYFNGSMFSRYVDEIKIAASHFLMIK